MGHLSLTLHSTHAETREAPFTEALRKFTDRLKGIGYDPVITHEWSTEVLPPLTGADQSESSVAEEEPADGFSEEGSYFVKEVPEATITGSTHVSVGHTYRHKGGGYYEILVDGETVDTVRGKAAAEAWAP